MKPSRALLKEAAAWRVRLENAAAPADQSAFDAWRAADPLHESAYQEVTHLEALARTHAQSLELQTLRRQTLNRVALRRKIPTWRYAAAACVLLAFGAGGWLLLRQHDAPLKQFASSDSQTYRTRLGERMAVTLADGSALHLNTKSAVRVTYSPTQRRVELLDGQAFFDVAKAPRRPFIVFAGDRSVKALGTRFDVRLEGKTVQVALLEGSILVANETVQAESAVRMKPNEVLSATGGQVAISYRADISRIASWKDGMVLFDNTPLDEAIAELNRYSAAQIKIDDPRLNAIRVSGSFPAGGSTAFTEAVEEIYPIKSVRAPDGNILLERKK